MGIDVQEVEIAPAGIPVKFLLSLTLLVVLPWSLVMDVASSTHLASLVFTDTGYDHATCYFSYLVGHVVSSLLFGFLSDLFGRKKVMLAVVGAATAYVPLFVAMLWAWSALQEAWGAYAMLLVVPCYLCLGLVSPIFAVSLSSAFDVSNSHTQLLSVIIVGILGHGFASHTLFTLAYFLVKVSVGNSLGFLIPLAVTAFFILALVAVAVWKVIPETLNAPVPHLATESLGEGMALSGGVQEDDDPFEGAGRVKGSAKECLGALVHNLRHSYVWVAFWSVGGMMSVIIGMNTTYNRMLITFNEVRELLAVEYSPVLRGLQLLLVEFAVLAVCLYFALKAPQRVINFGYSRVLFILTILFLLIAVCDTLASMVYALFQSSFMYVVCRLMGIALLQVIFPGAFIAKCALVILMSNCGFRNEGGFLMGMFVAAQNVVPACTQVVLDFFLLRVPTEEMWPYPLAFTAVTGLAVALVCLVFLGIRNNLYLNLPKSMAGEEWGAPHKLHMLWWLSAGALAAVAFALWLTLWITTVFSDD